MVGLKDVLSLWLTGFFRGNGIVAPYR